VQRVALVLQDKATRAGMLKMEQTRLPVVVVREGRALMPLILSLRVVLGLHPRLAGNPSPMQQADLV
jgi:hypothetical protein